jgi:hypothetical protein
MSDLASRSESALRALMRADRHVHDKHWAEQLAVDLEATKETIPAVRIERVHRRRPAPADDKINEAFKRRLGADMLEKTNADSVASFMLGRNDGLQTDRGVSRPVGVAFYVPDLRHGRGGQASGAHGQVRQGGVRPQERAPDYPVVAAWAGFLLFIGAGAFALGMAIHNEAIAQQTAPRPEPIYYCATGVEMPEFEPCKEQKDQRDI